jgi:hypothetical protein
MAERCALFVIIALGESLLVSGATLAKVPWTAEVVMGFVTAFVGAVAMWWLYFDRGMVEAHHRIAHSADPGRQARADYSYLHVFIVAGIILCAAGDELMLAHPAHVDAAGVAVLAGGPAPVPGIGGRLQVAEPQPLASTVVASGGTGAAGGTGRHGTAALAERAGPGRGHDRGAADGRAMGASVAASTQRSAMNGLPGS